MTRSLWGLKRETRRDILACILQNPGINKSQLRRQLGIGWGTVSHHVNHLRSSGRVRALVRARDLLLFPEDLAGPQTLSSAGRSFLDLQILARLSNQPGMSAKEIAHAVGFTVQAVRRRLQVMAAEGHISIEGKPRRFFADAKPTAIACFMAGHHPPLAPDVLQQILVSIEDAPGVGPTELSTRTGLATSTVMSHVKALEKDQRIATTNAGPHVHFFPRERPNALPDVPP